jgi:hypothetical protein
MVAAAPALADAQPVPLPPNRQQGLDMVMIDAEAMPAEPELAREIPEVEDVSWSGAPIDLLKPVHHAYTDLRRQLARYQDEWGRLPQVRVPPLDGVLAVGAGDPRVPILRERLGLPADGLYNRELEERVAHYQEAHGLHADGIAGSETVASLNRGAAYYERVILLNMERARRLPASNEKGKYILVDAGAARLWMYEDGRPVDSMKVIVGTVESKTPMMAALMRYASVNPYWNVPPDLVQKKIAPRVLADGKQYLADKRYEVLDSWEDDAKILDPDQVDWRAVADGVRELRVRQLPGEGNFMGDIKFMMPNEYGIYLHDTPGKVLFDSDDRWLSNGCVRVEDAHRLARWLFGRMPSAESPDRESDVPLDQPVPVYITYLTVGTADKRLTFRPDRYERDATVLARFAEAGDGMVDATDFDPGRPRPQVQAEAESPTKVAAKPVATKHASAKPAATAAKPTTVAAKGAKVPAGNQRPGGPAAAKTPAQRLAAIRAAAAADRAARRAKAAEAKQPGKADKRSATKLAKAAPKSARKAAAGKAKVPAGKSGAKVTLKDTAPKGAAKSANP